MDTLSRDNLQELLGRRANTVLSLYMPTHRAGGPEMREDMTRFGNMLRQAETALRGRGVKGIELQDTLSGLRKYLDNSLFWQHQGDGLAVFIDGGKPRVLRLPLKFEERCVAASRYDIKPLLPLLQGDGRFYILAVSLNRVRLLQGTRFNVSEMEDVNLPKNLQEALNIDEYVSSLQHQSMKGADIGGGPRGQAVYHGHGGGSMDTKKSDEIMQYFRRIDDALMEQVGAERIPLVFAGVDYLFPIYREASHYPEMVPQSVTGNPDSMKPQALHEAAWPLVEQRFDKERDTAFSRLGGFESDLASTDVNEILEAARGGRVETLFLAEGRSLFTNLDEEGNEFAADPDAPQEDLLNLLALQTLQKGGRVFTVHPDRLPNDQPAAAQFRFATERRGAPS